MIDCIEGEFPTPGFRTHVGEQKELRIFWMYSRRLHPFLELQRRDFLYLTSVPKSHLIALGIFVMDFDYDSSPLQFDENAWATATSRGHRED